MRTIKSFYPEAVLRCFSRATNDGLGGSHLKTRTAAILSLPLLALTMQAAAQAHTRTTAESVRGHFAAVNRKVLAMARDFPEDKYGYKLKPETRSFGEVIVHIASGNIYAAKAGRGGNVNWDEADPKSYRTKAEIVAMLQKSIHDADATLNSLPDEVFAKTIEPWAEVMEHSAEHYGLLVAYYRANGLVPPESRPK
jgi:hypothetical protein